MGCDPRRAAPTPPRRSSRTFTLEDPVIQLLIGITAAFALYKAVFERHIPGQVVFLLIALLMATAL